MSESKQAWKGVAKQAKQTVQAQMADGARIGFPETQGDLGCEGILYLWGKANDRFTEVKQLMRK